MSGNQKSDPRWTWPKVIKDEYVEPSDWLWTTSLLQFCEILGREGQPCSSDVLAQVRC